MSRMSVSVDPELLEEVRRLAKAKTKREALDQALRSFVQRKRMDELMALAGSSLVDMELKELLRWREASVRET